MCTRTRTSYGCGHFQKSTVECNSRSCDGLERYHYWKEGDCRECKRGGDHVTRGREGHGRYAQEMRKRDNPPHRSTTRAPLSPISTNPINNPWASASKKFDEWSSPIRKKADDGWLREHEKRENDLQSQSQDHSERGYGNSHGGSHNEQRRRDEREARIRDELRRIEESERIRVRRRAERSESYDSFGGHGSLGSLRSRTRIPPQQDYHSPHYDSWDHEPETDRYGYSHHVRSPSPSYHGPSYAAGEIVRDSGGRWKRW